MCKIMIIPGIKAENNDAATLFVQTARSFLTSEDKDAFGYVALGDSGIFGERWTKPHQAFQTEFLERSKDRLSEILGLIRNTDPSKTFNAFGRKTERVYSWLLHARWATCGGGIENAHPFISGETALIHNGVISNSKDLKNITSTCDSETILNEYLSLNANSDPAKIQDVVNKLSGWYAVGILGKINDAYFIDVFREPMAKLYASYVRELDAVVFCTTEQIIYKTCRELRFECSGCTEVPDECLLRIDPYSGSLLNKMPFSSGMLDSLTYAALRGDDPDSYGYGDSFGYSADYNAVNEAILDGMRREPTRTGSVVPVDKFIERNSGSTYAEARAKRHSKNYRRYKKTKARR